MRFSVLPTAELEASEAAIWYDDQRLGLGDDFVAEIHLAFDAIEREPRSFSKLEYYRGPREMRRYLSRHFPYLVISECRDDEILVVAVSHTRRKPLYCLDRLKD